MRRPQSRQLVRAAGLAEAGRTALSSGAALVEDLEDHTRLGGVLRRRDVGATKSTTSRGMQPRVVGRRVEAAYSVGVGWVFHSAD
ncbi:MAG: hypothetical protein ABJ056_02875, partial [Halioglobus sp.]